MPRRRARQPPARSSPGSRSPRRSTTRRWSTTRSPAASAARAATVTPHGWSWADADPPAPHTCAGCRTAPRASAGRCSSCSPPPGTTRFRDRRRGRVRLRALVAATRSGTWPDLRIGGHRRGASRRAPSPTIGSWCHGEAGIALTRCAPSRCSVRDPYAAEAEIALETTRARPRGGAAVRDRRPDALPRRRRRRPTSCSPPATAPRPPSSATSRSSATGPAAAGPAAPLGGTTPGALPRTRRDRLVAPPPPRPAIPSPLATPRRLTSVTAAP